MKNRNHTLRRRSGSPPRIGARARDLRDLSFSTDCLPGFPEPHSGPAGFGVTVPLPFRLGQGRIAADLAQHGALQLGVENRL